MGILQNFKHLCKDLAPSVSLFDTTPCIFAFLCAAQVWGGSTNFQGLKLSDLSADNYVEGFIAPRDPSSYYPNDTEIVSSYEIKTFWSNILAEDNKGVMKEMKGMTKAWQEKEDFYEYWQIDKQYEYLYVDVNGTYYDDEMKKAYLKRKMLRYADKRLMGEIKSAKEGTALHDVGKVRQALRPQTKFQFASNYKLKVRAKVLRGVVFFRMDNPYFNDAVLELKALKGPAFWDARAHEGKAKLHLRKSWEKVGLFSQVEYKFYDDDWFWEWSKSLTPRLSLVLTTAQNNSELPYSGASNKTTALRYGFSF